MKVEQSQTGGFVWYASLSTGSFGLKLLLMFLSCKKEGLLCHGKGNHQGVSSALSPFTSLVIVSNKRHHNVHGSPPDVSPSY